MLHRKLDKDKVTIGQSRDLSGSQVSEAISEEICWGGYLSGSQVSEAISVEKCYKKCTNFW
jgi:hypothetical protein